MQSKNYPKRYGKLITEDEEVLENPLL